MRLNISICPEEVQAFGPASSLILSNLLDEKDAKHVLSKRFIFLIMSTVLSTASSTLISMLNLRFGKLSKIELNNGIFPPSINSIELTSSRLNSCIFLLTPAILLKSAS